MTKKEMVAELVKMGIKANVKEKASVLEEKLNMAKHNENNKEEENTMKTQEQENTVKTQEQEKVYEVQNTTNKKEEKAMKAAQEKEAKAAAKKAAAALFENNQEMVLNKLEAIEGVTLEVYPNLPDWVKVQQAGKTALEIRFGKKELRVQADEKDAEMTEHAYKVVKSFSKAATFAISYNDPKMFNVITDLLKARAERLAQIAAEKEAIREAKEMEKKVKAAAKKAAKTAKKEEGAA